MLTGKRIALMLCAGLVLAALGRVAGGYEVTVKNDSYVEGGSVVVVGNFVPGEQAGARLTSPCNGYIVAVQIAWVEGTPGHGMSIERAIHIYSGSTFPTPGAQLALLEAPVLTPGAFNEFRYLDDEQSIPLRVPVVTGQQFYVSLEFDNPTDVGNGGPSVARDVNGCQSGKNVLYAIPGGWMNFCLFIQGDLLIRAVIDCEDPTGACCLPDGSCQTKTAAQCSQLGGTYQGNNTSCASVNCPQPTGACCIPITQGCINLTQADCNTVGGTWAGMGTSCSTYVCFPVGACCLPDGSCQDGKSPSQCSALGGTFQGHATTCATVSCPLPSGACCLPNGNCIVFVESNCNIVGGTWAGPGTNCNDANQNGKADACESGLKGDLNCDGLVNNQDIDHFLQALFDAAGYVADHDGDPYSACDIANGDFTGDGLVNNQDIDGFIGALFGG